MVVDVDCQILKWVSSLENYLMQLGNVLESQFIEVTENSKTNHVDDGFIMVTLSIVCKIFSGSHKSYNIL